MGIKVRPHFHCPVNGWDCPYYRGDCECKLEEPTVCPDFALFWAGDKPEEYTDYDELNEKTINQLK